MIVEKIRFITGSTLEIISDRVIPQELLKHRNVIAVVNMAANRFIEHLYRQSGITE